MKQKTYLRRLLADIARQPHLAYLGQSRNHFTSLVNRLYPHSDWSSSGHSGAS